MDFEKFVTKDLCYWFGTQFVIVKPLLAEADNKDNKISESMGITTTVFT